MPYHSLTTPVTLFLPSPLLSLSWSPMALYGFFSILNQFISFYSQLYVTYVLCFCIIFYFYSHSSPRIERTVLFDCTEGETILRIRPDHTRDNLSLWAAGVYADAGYVQYMTQEEQQLLLRRAQVVIKRSPLPTVIMTPKWILQIAKKISDFCHHMHFQ